MTRHSTTSCLGFRNRSSPSSGEKENDADAEIRLGETLKYNGREQLQTLEGNNTQKEPAVDASKVLTMSREQTNVSEQRSKVRKGGILQKLRFRKQRNKAAPPRAAPMPIVNEPAVESDPPDDDFPIPPSAVESCRMPRVRVGVISRNSDEVIISDDKFDSFSRMSDLTSPTLAKSDDFRQPLNFRRQHETLGHEAIRDIRSALKEMETQLVPATSSDHRVSRRKVMNALLSVADSLEDTEERDFVTQELEEMMQKERRERYHQINRSPLLRSQSFDDPSEGHWEDGDCDVDYSIEDENVYNVDNHSLKKDSQSFSLFSSADKLVGANGKDETENVLDDLQWTEFVASRRPNSDKSSIKSRKRSPRCDRVLKSSNINNVLQQSSSIRSERDSYRGRSRRHDDRHLRCQSLDHDNLGDARNRSWWRRHPVKANQVSNSRNENLERFSSKEDEPPLYMPRTVSFQRSSSTVIRL